VTKTVALVGNAITNGDFSINTNMAIELSQAFLSIDEYFDKPGHGPDGFEILEFVRGKIDGSIKAATYTEWAD
jgi:hypothetical protein